MRKVGVRMEKCVMMLFLGIGSIMDVRKREISAVLLGGFILTGAAVRLWKMAVLPGNGDAAGVSWIAGAAAGVLLLGAARLTNQALGYGDALAAATLGIWLGFIPAAEIFFFGMCLASVYAAWLFLVKHTGGKYRIVFLPFLLGGYLLWLFLEGKGAGV